MLVSSDSDFTRLASRIREQGLHVFGVGKKTTPQAFRRACKRFIYIENLLDDPAGDSGAENRNADGRNAREPSSGPVDDAAQANRDASDSEALIRQPPSKAVPLIAAAIRNHEEDWVPLSVIGSHIHEANPDFDPRTYRCAKLADLLEKTGQFEVNRNETPVRARMKRSR